nr:uncharacterized protein LOC119717522 [Anas platyrhynchos]
MGLKNSTSAFLGKIALNYKQLLHDRDILPQRNKRLRSCWTDHLAGVRGIGVLLLFPLQELFGAFISSVPVAFHAEAVTMLRQGLSYSLFYKTSCIRVLHHHFRPCGASIRQKLTLLSPISEQHCALLWMNLMPASGLLQLCDQVEGPASTCTAGRVVEQIPFTLPVLREEVCIQPSSQLFTLTHRQQSSTLLHLKDSWLALSARLKLWDLESKVPGGASPPEPSAWHQQVLLLSKLGLLVTAAGQRHGSLQSPVSQKKKKGAPEKLGLGQNEVL